MSHRVLVTTATGHQGSATIRGLLALSTTRNIPITIHALVRDPTSSASKALAALSPSVKLFAGNFDDPSSLAAAAQTCTALFLNVNPNPTSPDTEIQHAQNVLAACQAAGTVSRAVYTSASVLGSARARASLDAWPGMAWYMRSKAAIEDAVLTAPFLARGATVLRPAMFWTNFCAPAAGWMYPELSGQGVLRTALEAGLKLACLDPEDIGRFAAEALVGGEEWGGRVVGLASEHLTMGEIAGRLRAAVGGRREVRVVQLTGEEIERGRNVLVESELFRNEFRVEVDVEDLKGFGVPLSSWEEFVERERRGIEGALGLE